MNIQPQQDHEVRNAALNASVVWAGTIYGIQISDLVLLLTGFYTILLIIVLIWDKVLKPIAASRREAIQAAKDAAAPKYGKEI